MLPTDLHYLEGRNTGAKHFKTVKKCHLVTSIGWEVSMSLTKTQCVSGASTKEMNFDSVFLSAICADLFTNKQVITLGFVCHAEMLNSVCFKFCPCLMFHTFTHVPHFLICRNIDVDKPFWESFPIFVIKASLIPFWPPEDNRTSCKHKIWLYIYTIWSIIQYVVLIVSYLNQRYSFHVAHTLLAYGIGFFKLQDDICSLQCGDPHSVLCCASLLD